MTSFVLRVLLATFSLVPAAAGFEYAIVGDAGLVNDDHSLVRRSVKKAGVSALILPGDNLYETKQGYASIWNSWKERGFTFDVVAIGNHSAGYREEIRYFGMPDEAYSRVKGPARFIVLNSDNEKTVAAQLRFLNHELETAREPYVFIVYHHPTFTVSDRHNWYERKEFQLGLRRTLAERANRVTALIVGHDHIASLVSVSGVPMIVSGAVHESLPTQPRDYAEGPFKVETVWLFRNEAHWARLDVRSDEVRVSFVHAASDQVVCAARIAPRPIRPHENCARTTSKAKPVRQSQSSAGRK